MSGQKKVAMTEGEAAKERRFIAFTLQLTQER
jgi:hypothetical protein